MKEIDTDSDSDGNQKQVDGRSLAGEGARSSLVPVIVGKMPSIAAGLLRSDRNAGLKWFIFFIAVGACRSYGLHSVPTAAA